MLLLNFVVCKTIQIFLTSCFALHSVSLIILSISQFCSVRLFLCISISGFSYPPFSPFYVHLYFPSHACLSIACLLLVYFSPLVISLLFPACLSIALFSLFFLFHLFYLPLCQLPLLSSYPFHISLTWLLSSFLFPSFFFFSPFSIHHISSPVSFAFFLLSIFFPLFSSFPFSSFLFVSGDILCFPISGAVVP